MSALAQELAEYVRACFSGLWIETHEADEALAEIRQLCRDESWRLAVWNIESGLQAEGHSANEADAADRHDPLAAIRAAEHLAAAEGAGLMVLENLHRYLGSPEIVQALIRQIAEGKQRRTFIVILAPTIDLPRELEKLFVVLEHRLPDRRQLEQIAREIVANASEVPEGAELDAVLDAAAGLTRYEAEGAYSLSLVREGRLAPGVIWRTKAQQLKKTGLLSLYEGSERFDDLGGLEALKTFCLRALRRGTSCRPRGVLLLSPPGCGKSAACKALGAETGRPTLRLDIGALMGSLVGETERNVRRALAIAEAMQPCVLFVDEVDKALAGAASGASTDSGVAARMFGTLLTWLADRTSDVFVVATANSIDRLPPELTRAERFDGVFFIDLPGREQKDQIWRLHRLRYGIDDQLNRPDDDKWTGAEIAACCRLAALLDVPLTTAAQHVVPVAVAAAESVHKLRTWASGRCLSADCPGVYRAERAPRRRRGVRLDPSDN